MTSPPVRTALMSPAAWTAEDIGGRSGLERRLRSCELDACDALLQATAGFPVEAIDRSHFDDRRLNALAEACGNVLAHGRGAVIVSGLTLERYGQEGFQRIYWYLGRLLGQPAPQSERGDLLGRVRQEADNPFGRGYISNKELSFHNDFHEVLSLACLQTATKGGESGLASSLAIHNIMLVERPDLLEALYTACYEGIEAFYKISRPRDALARTFVPYFTVTDGVGSFHGLGAMFNDRAAAERDQPVPDLLVEALAAMRAIADRPGVGLWFSLQPGEMIFWHNWALLHARNAFENTPGRERELLRLWLRPYCRRSASPLIIQRMNAVDHIHATIGNHL